MRLHKSGQEVLLVHHRKEVVDTIRKRGVRLKEITGRIARARIAAKESLSRDVNAELILVTVKAYDTENLARHLKKSARTETTILSLQNGLGNIEKLSRQLGRMSVLAGCTSEAAMSLGPGDVVHTGTGRTWIGEPNGGISKRCLAINRVFRKASFASGVSNDIKGVLWAKTIVNSAINPISALTRLPNGDLQSPAGLRQLASIVVEEGAAVGRALGVALRPDPKTLISQVLSSAARNKSSMLLDVESGKKTEIRQLNGFISAAGTRHGVPTPYNDFLTALVVGLESSPRPMRSRSYDN